MVSGRPDLLLADMDVVDGITGRSLRDGDRVGRADLVGNPNPCCPVSILESGNHK
jgi:hypothetical protein